MVLPRTEIVNMNSPRVTPTVPLTLYSVLVSKRRSAEHFPGVMDSSSGEDESVKELRDLGLKLVENACNYLISKSYPPNTEKNERRSIRRKAKMLVMRNGEVFYKKKGREVSDK